MNQRDNNLKFRKSLNKDSRIKLSNSQSQIDEIKKNMINQYVNEYETLEIRKKENINSFSKNEIHDKDVYDISNSNKYRRPKQVLKEDNDSPVIIPQQVLDRKNSPMDKVLNSNRRKLLENEKRKYFQSAESGDAIGKNSLNKNEIEFKRGKNPIENVKNYKPEFNNLDLPKSDSRVINQLNNSKKDNSSDEGIDNILEMIVPDYSKQISINVDHVDLTFEVQNEKTDTLKEAFLNTLKRKKSKKFKIHALKDVSFQIHKGEKVGIIGYNGAGKSTLLKVITGIYAPDNGNVVTNGKISPLLSLGAGFDFNFSGRDNILLNGAVLGYDKKYLQSKIDEIIEFSELGDFINIPIKNYSSGMLAKLAFSIATLVNPDILIIDEILGVGDVNFQKKSSDKIKSLMDGGTTVLLVSHSLPKVMELCDKAIWIDNGAIRSIGEINKVCGEYLKDAEKASEEQLANIKFK